MLFSFRFNKRDRLFYSYLLSYFMIILVTLSMTILGYTLTIRTLEQEMATSNNYLLSQVTMNLDHQIQQIQQLNISLTDIPDMDTLSHKYFLSGSDLLKIKNLSQTLNNAKSSVSIIDDVIVYFHENDNIVTAAKRYNPKLKMLYLNEYYPLEEDFSGMVTFDDYNDIQIVSDINMEPVLVFRQNIFNDDFKSQLVSILILVSWSSLVESMPELEDGDVFLINDEDKVLHYPGNINELKKMTYGSLVEPYELMYQNLDNRDLVTFYAQGDQMDLKYGLVYAKSTFLAGLDISSF